MMNKTIKFYLLTSALLLFSPNVLADSQPFIPAGGISASNVYQPDGRKMITSANQFPYNTIVYIVTVGGNGTVYYSSGVIIAPNTVLTAGHVIYNRPNGGYIKSATVYQANANGTYNSNTAATVTGKVANPDWLAKDSLITNGYPSNNADDLGILNLSKNIGLSTGWMGMTSTLSTNQTISLVGFPGDHAGQMWGMSGNVSQISNPLFNYSNISELPGQSGSPIFNTSNNIVGINVADANYPNNTNPTHYVPSSLASQYPNYGVQLTASNINWIQNNVPALKSTALYRVYNPNNGEHLYTKSLYETTTLSKTGWNYEGVNSQQPATGNAVYRLYNPNSGEHFYKTSSFERDSLVKAGWRFEQIAFYSDTAKHTPIYRLFNPNAKGKQISHFYTSSCAERDSLVKIGWRYEQISWYGL
ncbi:MAG: trypsin-like peptidase domain-containing protein [Lactococcus lactis]|nr:trypsin-like peptidase domain-containing protein [Lactococcus lactis]MDU3891788.1 trypsin-like peptidase domain-containing protein [Lactococcus lactis]MDU4036914.1 trypsin-like peptidase domain-containing protein [Lactococcus lactis]MDU7299914.1 trypsin-like peptidase domain-containing protein [Lactococcus lactis]